METELIRPIVRIGNSSGVILPKTWIDHEARVGLIVKETSSIFADIIRILESRIQLSKVLGIYLAGSYAREEQGIDSDIDVIVISDGINKSIKKGKYEILVISKRDLENSLKNNILPILPMLKEAKPLFNESLIEELKKTPLTRKNVKWHIDTTKKSIKESAHLIEMTRRLKKDKIDDAVAYSLILRLRGIYIIDCLRNNRPWSNEEILKLVRKIAGSTISYERYKYVKDEQGKNKARLPLREAERLLEYIRQKNSEQEKWSRGLKG